jgi:flp pilus assembly protein tadB-like protein
MFKREKKEKQTPTKYLETSQLDYSIYVMTKQEYIFYLILAALVLFAIGYIFYQNIIVSLVFALLAFKYPSIRAKEIAANRQKALSLQFRDMLYSVSSAVNAGASVETSISMAMKDMEKQYADPNTLIIKELDLMASRLSFGKNIEEIFKDFAFRSKNEDVLTFSNIFDISKRQGGNIMQIIRQTTDVISEKIETKTEIETSLSGKKMEQKVLTAMPILLVLFMTKTTGGFMDAVFHTVTGRIAATAAIACILIGFLWSKKITDIEV